MNNFQNGRVSVWWDLDNCSVPQNVNAFHVAKNVSAMLLNACLLGPATIDAFGDTKRLGQKVLEGLSSTGINLNHIPSGNKDAADKAILVAMLLWALDNSPPSSLVLISGDGDFANALHRLRLKGYNLLLVQPDQPIKSALLGAASSVWYWTSVVNGQMHRDGFSMAGPQPRWVSVNDMKYEFPKDIWIDLGHFLCSERNRELIMKSSTRLEGARVLKHSGPAKIQHLLMGQIILLLNQSIQKKKWLRICGKGWSSVVINLQAVMTFIEPVTQEQVTKAADLAPNGLENVMGSSKKARKLATGLLSTKVEPHIVQQRSKEWLLQLPCSSKGYGLPYIQKGLMEGADIFMSQKQLEDMISQFTDDFRLERNQNDVLLLFQKRSASIPAVKQCLQTEPVNYVVGTQQKKEADVAPQTSDSVEGELGSHKGGQLFSTPEPRPWQEWDIPESLLVWLFWGALAGLDNGYM